MITDGSLRFVKKMERKKNKNEGGHSSPKAGALVNPGAQALVGRPLALHQKISAKKESLPKKPS